MNFVKKLSIFLLITILFLSVFSFSSSADSINVREQFLNPDGETLIVANRGYTKSFPENSVQAIAAAQAAGADIVKLDVRKTSDDVLILMADETVTRTCSGYGEKTTVSEMTYEEITNLSLLERNGGDSADVTDYAVPSLEEVFEALLSESYNRNLPADAKETLVMLDASFELREEIFETVSSYNFFDYTIFLFNDAKPSEINEWKEETGKDILTVSYFKGNIIFSALSFVSDAAETGNEAVFLASSNPYGVVFGETVTEKTYGNTRLMADTTDSTLCGKIRTDTEVWWDDLISRGYDMIVTDYVPELKEYIDDTAKKTQALNSVYDTTVTNWTAPDITGDKYHDYKLAYDNAVKLAEKCIKDSGTSRSDIVTATYNLQKAYDDINENYKSLEDGSAGKTVTPVTIILSIAAVAVVVTAEIFVYKKKKKQ